MNKRNLRIVSLLLGGVVIAIFFQNCGKAGFDSSTGLAINSSTPKTSLPFAFDMTFDQISYNSCFGNGTAGKQGFYTIRAGAYSSGGVRVTPEFFESVRNSQEIKPIYPATEVSKEQIKNALARAADNQLAVPQMALRTRSNIQQLRTPGAKQATLGLDFFEMLGDLTDDRWLSPLINTELPQVYFNMAPNNMRNLEAAITYNKDEGTAHGLRKDLSSHGMLALTFKVRPDIGDATIARSPNYQDLRVAYGRGYILGFEAAVAEYTKRIDANAIPNMYNPQNIMTSITEVDLRDPSKASASLWSCPQHMRFLIVRREDADTYCPTDSWDELTNSSNIAAYKRQMEIVRRHLQPEHWDVSLVGRCVVPKANEGRCYRNDPDPIDPTKLVPIAYDQRETCFQALDEMEYPPPVPLKQCAQYISICNRN